MMLLAEHAAERVRRMRARWASVWRERVRRVRMEPEHAGRVRARCGGSARCALAVALVATTAVAAGACGGTSQAATATGSSGSSSGQTVQTMTTVKRGDLVATLNGKVTLTVSGGKATATTTFTGAGASQVAAGQTVTLIFMGQGGTAGQGSATMSPRPSVAPSAASGGSANGGAPGGVAPSGAPNGGAPGAGQGGVGRMGGTTVKGTVTSVQHSGATSASVRIAIAKLPSGVTATSVGMAVIDAGVLARNVLLVPTAAIKGSGGSATVQVIVNGKTTTRKVVVGAQTRAESEIVSGLSVGDNVVYERTGMSIPGVGGGAGGSPPQGQGPPASTSSSN
jgi:membrane fusion protein, macrolide-specific efflux system